MNEYVAGCSMLAISNAFPDLVVNLTPLRAQSGIFTISVSNALGVLLLAGGMICYLRPFRIGGYCVVRDLICLFLAVQILEYMIKTDQLISEFEAIVLCGFYAIYLSINFWDQSLVRRKIKKLRVQIAELSELPETPKIKATLKHKHAQLLEYEIENRFTIHSFNYTYHFGISHHHASSRHMPGLMEPDDLIERYNSARHKKHKRYGALKPAIDTDHTRRVLYNKRNSRNRLLFSEFWGSLIPIDLFRWQISNTCGRLVIALLAPMVLLITIFIPTVDYQLNKHGWSKLLNCTQIITNPALIITLVRAMYAKKYNGMVLALEYEYPMWSLCATVPLAICVFLHSRTDMPPVYHLCFALLTTSMSILVIVICALELEVLCSIMGFVFNLSENFISATFRPFARALRCTVICSTLTRQGYGKMAYAAVLASPFCTIVLCMGLACVVNLRSHDFGNAWWLIGQHGANTFVFFTLAVVFTFVWIVTFGFRVRRSVAIFSFILYMTYLLYAFLVEWNCIHHFGFDPTFDPK
ncbi:uncharacterized protein LOC108595661 isoform X2 [Drosophila busckii]|nr:uncharacterized protein LOC108595661 isoform X2 [Drosophila busckii]